MTQATGQREAGFTLLELLIGLALLALMTGLLAGALGGVRQTRLSHDRRALAESLEPVEAYLRHLLVDMRPVRVSTLSSTPLLEARADSLTLVSGYGPPGGYGGLHRVTLRLVETAWPGVFDLEETRALHRPVQTPPRGPDGETRTRLLTGVAGFSVRYFGAQPGGAMAWTQAWPSPAQLPHLVAIDIAFPPGDVRRWTPLIVAVAAAR